MKNNCFEVHSKLYLVSLHNKNSRDSSLHYIFLFHLGDPWGLPGDSLLLYINIKGYPSFGMIKAHDSEVVKIHEENHRF